MNETWCLTSKKISFEDRLAPGFIYIEGETIKHISDQPDAGFKGRILDVGNLAVLPGFVDTHVHVNEPGRTDWEGFETATQAAAAGGVTTLVDMPLNCIPVTVSAEALKQKCQAIFGKITIDVGFWGGVIPENITHLDEFLECGILGVKSFMIDSGIPEFPPVSLDDVDRAMPYLKRHGLPYLFHAELDQGETKSLLQGPSYSHFLHSRPKSWENHAIEALTILVRKHGTRTHVVHLSSDEAIAILRLAQKEGLSITAETCPHYLTLSAEQVDQFQLPSQKTLFKCCPPIRADENRQNLWKGLKEGVISMVVSDHSPCVPELKGFEKADFAQAWGGISALQFTASLLWTESAQRAFTLPQLSQWTSKRPAQLAGLFPKKGVIRAGSDADFAIFDPQQEWVVSEKVTLHRHKGSPYLGKTVRGKVVKTILRGTVIFDNNQFLAKTNGRFLFKNGKGAQ